MDSFRDKMIDAIIEHRDQFPRHPHDACSYDIGDIVLGLFIGRLQEIADQYPATVFDGSDAIVRCAGQGIVTDGIAGTAIRERMLAEIKSLGGEQS